MPWVNRLLCFIALLGIALPMSAQLPIWTGQQDLFTSPFADTAQHQVYAFSLLEGGSNALPSAFLSRLLTSGTITNELRDQGFDLLDEDNYGGYQMRTGIAYQKRTPSSKWLDHIVISLESRTQVLATFSCDLYGLALYGNARYEGQTALFEGTFMSTTSHVLGIGGASTMRTGNNTFQLTYGLRFVQGLEARMGSINGSLYTAPQGTSIEGSISGFLYRSDTVPANALTVGGWGLGAHLAAQYTTDKWQVSFQGIMWDYTQWRSDRESLGVNVVDTFTGVNYSNLLNGASIDPPVPEDYIETGEIVPVPIRTFTFSGQVVRSLGDWDIGVGIRRSLPVSNFSRFWQQWGWEGQVAAAKTFDRGWMVNGHVTVGGWTPVNLGVSVQKAFPFGMHLQLGTNHLASLALPQQLPGTSFHAVIGYAF